MVVFEGWDASGKGGNIRRLTAAMDPRTYRVISVAAPTDEEKAHHYLWRFWRHVPRAGYVTIYDRSWYGRVLVERVEGFARPDEWSRAYLEINDFEQQLVAHGIVLAKYWLHVDAKEQLRRFHEREDVAWKKHKIGPEDWRNREKWDAYEEAVDGHDRAHEHRRRRRGRSWPRTTSGSPACRWSRRSSGGSPALCRATRRRPRREPVPLSVAGRVGAAGAEAIRSGCAGCAEH